MIGVGVILTIVGIIFIVRGYRRNKGQGGLRRNVTSTIAVLLSFAAGYLTAAYQTHDYFKERTHHNQEESKEQVLLMDDNIDPIILNPINRVDEMSKSMKDAIEMNNVKEAMKAEMMKHATVTKEVSCDCPYPEQLEKTKDSTMNIK